MLYCYLLRMLLSMPSIMSNIHSADAFVANFSCANFFHKKRPTFGVDLFMLLITMDLSYDKLFGLCAIAVAYFNNVNAAIEIVNF